MEAVFKALADSHRRTLLDRLFERDGQTLLELEAALPEMTRFGVMKHLRVLEGAGLVVTRREGREKLHYLNPVPIRLVLERWISKYAEPWVEAMVGLKHVLEESTMAGIRHVYQVYIRTTPEKLWDAMVNPEMTAIYFGGRIQSIWEPGAAYGFQATTVGGDMHHGTVIEIDPPHRLVQTFEHDYPPEAGGGKADPSRVTWEIAQMGATCRLTLTHEFPAGESMSSQGASEGWPMVLSGLKTLLETGEPLQIEFGDSKVGAS
ncbi:MAG TPA: SRPBCC domain-containing protein [Dehalococcoidia bacterium]|nr:SRPBCC domain-containing protein [Dehalococcoidia bacterium]